LLKKRDFVKGKGRRGGERGGGDEEGRRIKKVVSTVREKTELVADLKTASEKKREKSKRGGSEKQAGVTRVLGGGGEFAVVEFDSKKPAKGTFEEGSKSREFSENGVFGGGEEKKKKRGHNDREKEESESRKKSHVSLKGASAVAKKIQGLEPGKARRGKRELWGGGGKLEKKAGAGERVGFGGRGTPHGESKLRKEKKKGAPELK